MSIFSEKLQEYVAESGIRITVLSKASGIERSYLQKILAGNRFPAERETVQQLSKALMLTVEQGRDLLTKYDIVKIGETVYYRRRHIKEMLEDVAALCTSPQTTAVKIPCSKLDKNKPVCAVYGKNDITTAGKALLEAELAREAPCIRIVVQPDCKVPMENLLLTGRCHPELQIEHIFCLNSTPRHREDDTFNVDYINAIIPLIFCGCRYQPYFYYDTISSHINSTTISPNLLLTRDAVMLTSYDDESSLILFDPDAITFYNNMFDQMLQSCHSAVARSNSPLEFLSAFMCSEKSQNASCPAHYTLQNQPCMAMFYNEQLLLRVMKPEAPGFEEIRQYFSSRAKQAEACLANNAKVICYFTEQGLDDFLSTGRLHEVPSQFSFAFPPRIRHEMLENILQMSENGQYIPHIVNPSKFRFSTDLEITAFDESNLIFTYNHAEHGAMLFLLNEQSVSYALWDFLESIEGTDTVYPVDWSIACIREKLKQFDAARSSRENQ